MPVELGDRVKDKISGLVGIVIGVTDWLYGCRRMSIQAETAKDGRPVEGFVIDEPQCELIDKSVIKRAQVVVSSSPAAIEPQPPPRRHGPRPDVDLAPKVVARR